MRHSQNILTLNGLQRIDPLLLLSHCAAVCHRQPRVQASYCCGYGTAGVLQAADNTGGLSIPAPWKQPVAACCTHRTITTYYALLLNPQHTLRIIVTLTAVCLTMSQHKPPKFFSIGVLCVSLFLQVPFFFKHAVDALSIDPTGLTTAPYLGMLHLTPVALLLGYGISRWAGGTMPSHSVLLGMPFAVAQTASKQHGSLPAYSTPGLTNCTCLL